jgi:hypothetical protein
MRVIHTSKLHAKAIFSHSSHGGAKHDILTGKSDYNKTALRQMLTCFHEKPRLTNITYTPAVLFVNLYRHLNINLNVHTGISSSFVFHAYRPARISGNIILECLFSNEDENTYSFAPRWIIIMTGPSSVNATE